MAKILSIETSGRSMIDITGEIENIILRSDFRSGVVHIFIQHTSASLTVQENADPDVKRDLLAWLDRLVPENGPYLHTAEGADDMPAHIKAAITSTALSIPFEDGRLLTGAWQGIYVIEHRHLPHRRRIVVTLLPAA